MATKNPKAPAHLGTRGRSLWRSSVDGAEFQAHELAQLEIICRMWDRICRIEDELIDAPLTELGSKDQTIVNPLIVELRQQQAQFTSQVAKLGIPVDESGVINPAKGERSSSARALARARWDRAS